MVAPHLVDQQNSNSGFGSVVPATRTKLIPRRGVNDAWKDDMHDLLASKKLTRISGETGPPSKEQLTAMLPALLTAPFIDAIHRAVVEEWWTEATLLYQIVRASIDLSGIFEKTMMPCK